MKIATWNINGVKARLDNVLTWLKEADPDIACLQEIKSVDENFPREAFEDAGYNVETHGQKSFNGVALLSKRPLEDVRRGLPGDPGDEQARFIDGLAIEDDVAIRIAGIYLPNGNPIGTEKFDYKKAWMDRLIAYAEAGLEADETFLIAGDYNIIPTPADCANPKAWLDDALYQPESRDIFFQLTNLGLTDAVRATEPAEQTYTFWDYQAGAWQKNNGIRIDHILLSPRAADRLTHTAIDKHTRGWEKPSDHVPVWVELTTA